MSELPTQLWIVVGSFFGTLGGVWLLGWVLQSLGWIEISNSSESSSEADGASGAACGDGGGACGGC